MQVVEHIKDEKPKLLLLADIHGDIETHNKQAEEVIRFEPEICFLEMYSHPDDIRICERFSEVDMAHLRETWKWMFPFDIYIPLIEALRKVKAESVPLTPPPNECEHDFGNNYMKRVIQSHKNRFSRGAVVVGYAHLIGEKGANYEGVSGEGLIHLLENDFEKVVPEYVRREAMFGRFF